MGCYDDQWSAREYKKSPPKMWLFVAHCGQATAMQGMMWSTANSSSCLLMGICSELRDEAHSLHIEQRLKCCTSGLTLNQTS